MICLISDWGTQDFNCPIDFEDDEVQPDIDEDEL